MLIRVFPPTRTPAAVGRLGAGGNLRVPAVYLIAALIPRSYRRTGSSPDDPHIELSDGRVSLATHVVGGACLIAPGGVGAAHSRVHEGREVSVEVCPREPRVNDIVGRTGDL